MIKKAAAITVIHIEAVAPNKAGQRATIRIIIPKTALPAEQLHFILSTSFYFLKTLLSQITLYFFFNPFSISSKSFFIALTASETAFLTVFPELWILNKRGFVGCSLLQAA